MTRTQLGPNGEQQRVTVERDFKSEAELNRFLKEFEENLAKTSTAKQTKSESFPSRTDPDDLIKSPGYVLLTAECFLSWVLVIFFSVSLATEWWSSRNLAKSPNCTDKTLVNWSQTATLLTHC